MASITGEVTDVTIIDQDQVEITIRRGGNEDTYRFQRFHAPPLAAIDFDWQFQHDFQDQNEAFLMILGIVRRALRGEILLLPLRLPEEPGATGPAANDDGTSRE